MRGGRGEPGNFKKWATSRVSPPPFFCPQSHSTGIAGRGAWRWRGNIFPPPSLFAVVAGSAFPLAPASFGELGLSWKRISTHCLEGFPGFRGQRATQWAGRGRRSVGVGEGARGSPSCEGELDGHGDGDTPREIWRPNLHCPLRGTDRAGGTRDRSPRWEHGLSHPDTSTSQGRGYLGCSPTPPSIGSELCRSPPAWTPRKSSSSAHNFGRLFATWPSWFNVRNGVIPACRVVWEAGGRGRLSQAQGCCSAGRLRRPGLGDLRARDRKSVV